MSRIKDYVDLAASNPALFDTVNKYDIDGIESGFNENTSTRSFGEYISGDYDGLNTQYGKQSLSKINGGQVLQYPVDLDTSIQDYFEIQIFKYRPAKVLPGITRTSQGYGIKSNKQGVNNETNKGSITTQSGTDYSYAASRRQNRQNQRLEELQGTIQLPMPSDIKDGNRVDWGGKTMGSLEGELSEDVIKNMGGGALGGTDFEGGGFGETLKGVTQGLKTAIEDKGFRRRQQLNLIAAAGKTLGLNVDVDQALNRKFGVVKNPNLELLFTGPQLRDFTFMFRFSPRSSDESAKVRMIIRALKQHMSTKKNPKRGAKGESTGNWLLGTPDVFKLRYIKAKTQQDIKGLNKFKTCALKSINVDYTGGLGRFAAYDEDSQPITTFVTLTFGELVPLYDQDYLEFDSHDDVGL
tara:strand:- start:2359 stop:3588 length:1230 start_codon:yes stop_codon:yes gene_type:complete